MEDRGLKMEDGDSSGGVLRLFVAISPPEQIKSEIEKTQRKLRAALPGNFIRWTKPAQFHLTLKFLGNVVESRVAELVEAVRDACFRFAPLQLRAEHVGFFQGARAPRVLWVGVRDEKNLLGKLQECVETKVKNFTENAGSAGCAPPGASPARREQKFTGHITLARIQRANRRETETVAAEVSTIADQFFGEWRANSVELIRSELFAGGSRYSTVAAIQLSGKA
jgi:2'-5' RNA ligase